MELRQLEFFVHVAELGSFTRASNFLSVAQPVLSRNVRALEVEFRQVLLERNGRGVTLTEAGKRFLEHGRSVLAQIERARLDMEEGRGAFTGRLVVALPPSVSHALTAPLVRAFRSRFPGATVCVLEGLSTNILEWLTIGRVDCAVVYTVPTSVGVDLVPVLNEQLHLVSRRSDRDCPERSVSNDISLAEVARKTLVMPSRPHSIRMLVEGTMAQASLKPQIELEIESIPAILTLVCSEELHAILSLKAVHLSGRIDDFTVRPIRSPTLETMLWIATSAQRPRGPLLNQVVPMLQDLLLDLWSIKQSV
ncbi:LysR substrate-binding domain-containing protein [Caballeronia sp. INML2]|uniref:LysR substrate-binding domain-containing protein n=1 Tax=Caballeronia sp. INML2 TaxID=2921748 RepID=UPI002029750F|nr:LysR substrate-binding domain-containing protein [Caballeronia sp. INML2]